MKPGDISITFLGGHKLEVKKKGTILFEYKTGPYKGNTNDLKYFKKKIINLVYFNWTYSIF